MKLCVGLTGGIGCGKSTVSKLFAEHGAGIIDTDVIAHQLTQSHGSCISAINAAFGSEYITKDGGLDRDKMRGLIFSDTIAKQRLELLMHPLIFEQAKLQIQQLQAKPYIILVVPLLLTSPAFLQPVQRILVVDCAEERQVKRVIERSRMNEIEVRAIIAQQTPRVVRLQHADDVINNDFNLGDLVEQVDFLHKFYSIKQNSN
jgi:dephospho-CoA kinase